MRSIIITTSIILIYAFTAFAQAPQVVTVTPAQNEVSAAITSNITATFDIDMDPATIDNSTFSVYSRTYGYLSGTITYDQPTRTATFDPTRDFFHGDVITATLTTGIGSLGGTPMDRGFSWTFTVIAGGTGAFGAIATYDVWATFGHYALFVSDLNMDDYPDIIAGQISVFLNNGDGTFPTRSDYPQIDYIHSICAADFDRDDFNDIAAVMHSTVPGGDFLIIMMNNGDGTFGAAEYIGFGDFLEYVCAVDIDNDTDLDLVIGGVANDTSGFFLFSNDGSGNFTYNLCYTTTYSPDELFTGDFNNNGAPDIAATGDNLTVFYNNGEGTFSGPVYSSFPGQYFYITGADFNSDGFVDLAMTTFVERFLYILINDGIGNFSPAYNYLMDCRPLNLCVADLNGDNNIDISMTALKGWSDDNTFLFFNNGDGSMTLNSSFNVANSSRCYDIFASDLDLDGDMDLVDYTSSAHSITVMKNLPACGYVTGDVNDDGGYNGLDVVYSVNYFKGGNPPVYDECDCPVGGFWYVSGDVNASCDFNGLDITYGVAYFKGGDSPQPCPECPPTQ